MTTAGEKKTTLLPTESGPHLEPQAPDVQRMYNTTCICWINHYLVKSMVCFTNTYPPDSDLSGG